MHAIFQIYVLSGVAEQIKAPNEPGILTGRFHDTIVTRNPNEVSCHKSKPYYRTLYGADFLATAWTPFTFGEPTSTEKIFNITLTPAADCLFYAIDGYHEDKTKLMDSKLQVSSAGTVQSLRESESTAIHAAISATFQKVAASLETSNSNSHEAATSVTEEYSYFLRSVDVVDLKARISYDKPPLHPVFKEQVLKMYDSSISTETRRENLRKLLELYPFYLKEMWAGSSFAQVMCLHWST